jgi:hypothetical protein
VDERPKRPVTTHSEIIESEERTPNPAERRL